MKKAKRRLLRALKGDVEPIEAIDEYAGVEVIKLLSRIQYRLEVGAKGHRLGRRIPFVV